MYKVMLIDDDPSIHESLRAVVEEAGYGFCGALSGREGLRLLDNERPDLLLLDVDGIITDDPANTKEVISNANDSIIEDWMKRLIYKY